MDISQLDDLESSLLELEEKSRLRWRSAMAPRQKEEKKGPRAALARFISRYQIVLAVLASIGMGALPILGLFSTRANTTKIAHASLGSNADSSASAPDFLPSHEPLPRKESKSGVDPVQEVIRKIQSGDFKSPDEVAAGVFLLHFSLLAPKLNDLDTSGLSPRRRGADWSDLEGLFKIPEAPWERKVRPRGTFRLRFVRCTDTWKLENLRVFSDEVAP